MKISIALIALIFILFPSVVFSQISIREYKQSEEQTFYVTTDSNTQKFNAKGLKKQMKTSPQLYYTWYKYNQIFTSQGGYDGRILNGEYTSSYKNNALKMKGHYADGLKVGTWYEWSADGKLKEVSNWKSSLRNGVSTIYDNGVIVRLERYKNNLLNGKIVKYENGKQIVERYKNGKKQVPHSRVKSKPDQSVEHKEEKKIATHTSKAESPQKKGSPTLKSETKIP